MGTGARYGLLACLTAVLASGLIWDRMNPPGPGSLMRRGPEGARDTVRILIGGAPVPPAAPPGVPGGHAGTDAGAAPRATSPPAQGGPAPAPHSPVEGPATTHRVEAGDTLGAIALRHLGTSRRAAELASHNGLRLDSTLRVGQVLRIPGAAPVVPDHRPAPPPGTGGPVTGAVSGAGGEDGRSSQPVAPSPVKSSASARSHTVVAGDSLSRIARRYYGGPGDIDLICHANGIARDDILRPGQVLRLP